MSSLKNNGDKIFFATYSKDTLLDRYKIIYKNRSTNRMIPVNEPRLGSHELEYVMECLKTGWISSEGRFIEAFEQKWADY